MQTIIRYTVLYLFMLFFSILHAQTSYTLYVGDRQLLTAPNPPTGAIYQTAWGTSGMHLDLERYGSSGAYVTVTGFFEGSEQVQCDYYWRWYDTNGRMYTNHATAYYTVKCKQVTITPTPTEMTLSVGEGKYLSYSIFPSTVYPKPTVLFSSGNTNIVQVNSNGYVNAVGAGCTYITLKNSMGPSASCSVKVISTQPTGVSLPSNVTVGIEESISLTPTIIPSGASTTFTWWTEDENIATVSSTGLVTGGASGNTKIWVKTAKGGYTDCCEVDVVEPRIFLSSTKPLDNSYNILCNITPSAIFSTELYKGTNFNNIKLIDALSGTNVIGTVNLNGNSVVFIPQEKLKSNTKYTFVIPAHALQNKWQTSCDQHISVNFSTEIYAKDVKYLNVWTKDGIVTSFVLDRKPKLTYNTDTGEVLVNSRTEEITFKLDEVYKYTLDTTSAPIISSMYEVISNNTKVFFQKNAIIIEGCAPNTEINVYSLSGIVTGHTTIDASGKAVLYKDSIPKGINIVKVGKMSYKILVK